MAKKLEVIGPFEKDSTAMSKADFKYLQDYYRQCYELVDVFHFNSNVARTLFERILGNVSGVVAPITHQSIKDNRIEKKFDTSILRIGFIGAETPYKGLPLLKRTLTQIDSSKWRLDVWGGRVAKDLNAPIFYRGKFDNQIISQVYNDMDVLVVPSIWKETFSLVALEALSYGVPVLVSKNVGAQDVVMEYDESFVYSTDEELLAKLRILANDRTELNRYNRAILTRPWHHDMLHHAQDIVEKIYKM